MSRWLRRGAALAAAVLLLVLVAGMVLGKGQLLGGKLRTGDNVTVPADEKWRGDLYLLGGRVTMAGFVYAKPWLPFWIAAAGGGGLILGGLWMRRV